MTEMMDQATAQAIREFQTLQAEIEKRVRISIDTDDFRVLKQAGYKLCFAKRVGDHEYNVVWQSSDAYLQENEFSWLPLYQLFASNTFREGYNVTTSTRLVHIGLGQTSVLDELGYLNDPTTGGPNTAFTMNNEYRDIHPGVSQLVTPIAGEPTSTPIYVAPSAAVKGPIGLTPVERVIVWFEQNIQTSTMFSEARSNSVEIDLTRMNEATRRYSNGEWITP